MDARPRSWCLRARGPRCFWEQKGSTASPADDVGGRLQYMKAARGLSEPSRMVGDSHTNRKAPPLRLSSPYQDGRNASILPCERERTSLSACDSGLGCVGTQAVPTPEDGADGTYPNLSKLDLPIEGSLIARRPWEQRRVPRPEGRIKACATGSGTWREPKGRVSQQAGGEGTGVLARGAGPQLCQKRRFMAKAECGSRRRTPMSGLANSRAG